MKVILLEDIEALGRLGDTVNVKDGYARNYLIPKGLAVAGFMTHATLMPGASDRHTELYEKWAARGEKTFETMASEKGSDWLSYFHCKGGPNPGIEQFIRSTIITDEAEWAEYVADIHTHPDATDLENARAFAREVIGKLG